VDSQPEKKSEAQERNAQRADSGWFHALIVALILDVGVFGILGRSKEMSIGGGLLVLGLVFTRFEIFDSFKGFGLEAKMREKIDQAEKVVSDAYASMEQTRELAKALAKNAFTVIARVGLYAPLTTPERVAAVEELRDGLRVVGISENEIDSLATEADFVLRWRHAIRLESLAAPPQAVAEIGALRDYSTKRLASAAEHMDVVKKYGMTGEAFEAAQDFLHFEREGKLRRPEVWGDE
jgi:hypothetical protein